MARTLTEKERRFVDAYLGEARGNGTEAARLAGYSTKNLRHQASRLLTKANIAEAVAERQAAERDESIATARELDAAMTSIVRTGKNFDRIKATSELNRVMGRHLTRLANPDGSALSPPVVHIHLPEKRTNGHA